MAINDALYDALYHEPGRRLLQDVVTCIREGVSAHNAGRRLNQNAEQHIKSPAEMRRLFKDHSGALGETVPLSEPAPFFPRSA